MKNLLKLSFIAFLAIIVTCQNYPFNTSLYGYYSLNSTYSTSSCHPTGLYVYYNNNSYINPNNTTNSSSRIMMGNSSNTTNSSTIEFIFDFPWVSQCYNYSIYGFYSVYPAFIQENTTTYYWDPQNDTRLNSSGIVIIKPYNITITIVIYNNSQVSSITKFVLDTYISPTPPMPNLPSYLAIHSYLYPNYASNTSCYPLMLQVQNISSNTSSNITTTNAFLNFTWIWQNSSACTRYGLYDQSEGIANFTCGYSEYCNWTLYSQWQNLSIQGTWSEDNELLQVTFFEPFYNSYTMVESIPPFLPLNGIWAINTYLNPDYYSNEYCYPSTLQFQILDCNLSTSYNNELSYLYDLEVYIPCIDECQTSCGIWNTQIYINGTSYSNYWDFLVELDYTTSLSGWWDSVNNSLTMYQTSSDMSFSYAMVQIN